jgi:hypothetical protein
MGALQINPDKSPACFAPAEIVHKMGDRDFVSLALPGAFETQRNAVIKQCHNDRCAYGIGRSPSRPFLRSRRRRSKKQTFSDEPKWITPNRSVSHREIEVHANEMVPIGTVPAFFTFEHGYP